MSRKSIKKDLTPPSATMFSEVGSTGLKRTGTLGTIYEEFLRDLYGDRAIRVYREMRDNDPIIGAMFFVIETLIRNVTWRVEGDDPEQVDFIESCTQDMSHTWEDFITEALSMLTYGWSWHEVIYKRRMGDVNDPTKRSKYNDGKIGWRKIPIRAQETRYLWQFDEEGGIQGLLQIAPPEFRQVLVPIERSLLFRVGQHKNNPEGRSLLRNAYRPWYLKKRMEELEAIGTERDLAGIPTIYRTADIAAKHDDALKDIIRNVRRDEQEGILLPLAYDDKGNKQLVFELMSAAGSRQLDISGAINRYDQRIAMTVMADFIMLGHSATGSWALADSKTSMFADALGAILGSISSVINRVAIPRLLAINGYKLGSDIPKLVAGDIETPDLKELGSFVTALAGAGAALFPDEGLENYLRQAANLPKKSSAQEPQLGMPPKPKATSAPSLPADT